MNISVTGHVLVSDILTAFGSMVDAALMERIDEQFKERADERIMFDDCEVDEYEALDALENAGQLPEPETIGDPEERGMIALAEAIRCGETDRAELLMDSLFGHEPTIREWIDRGRYSMKARKMRAAAVAKPGLRTAA